MDQLEELQEELKEWREECLERIAGMTDEDEKRQAFYKYHVQKVSFERRFNFLQKQIIRKRKTRQMFCDNFAAAESAASGLANDQSNEQTKKLAWKLMGSCYVQPSESLDERIAFLCKLSLFLHDSDLSPSKLKTFDELIRREIYFIKSIEDSKLQFNTLILGVRLRLTSEFTATFKSRMN